MKSFDKNKNHRQDKIKQHSMSYVTFLSILNSLWYLNEIEHGISLNRNVSYRMFHFNSLCFFVVVFLSKLLILCLPLHSSSHSSSHLFVKDKAKSNHQSYSFVFCVLYYDIFIIFCYNFNIGSTSTASLILDRSYW